MEIDCMEKHIAEPVYICSKVNGCQCTFVCLEKHIAFAYCILHLYICLFGKTYCGTSVHLFQSKWLSAPVSKNCDKQQRGATKHFLIEINSIIYFIYYILYIHRKSSRHNLIFFFEGLKSSWSGSHI